jgi:hypothetical protein
MLKYVEQADMVTSLKLSGGLIKLWESLSSHNIPQQPTKTFLIILRSY